MSNLIKCKHPRIIRHPKLADWLLDGFDTIVYPNGYTKTIPEDKKYHALMEREWYVPELNIILYYELEREYQKREYGYLNLSPIVEKSRDIPVEYKHLYNPVYSITQEEALQFSIMNKVTGETRELFLIVPCSHCVLCIDNKKNKLSSRFILESLEHDNSPMFVRLSFDQQHYPKNVDDLQEHTRPIQLFHKRLRRYMERAGMNTDFKYFVTSEYGGERGRLHYHALYFGLHNLNYVPNAELKK